MARVALLAGSDALAILLAGTAAVLLWAYPVHSQPLSLYAPVAPLVLLVVLGYAQAGLYPGFGLGPVETIRRYCLVTATAFLLLAALVFALKVQDQYSRVTVALAFSSSLAFIACMRWATLRLARRWAWWALPVVTVAGGGGRSGTLAGRLASADGREFRPVGSLDLGAGAAQRDALAEAQRYADAGVEIAFADFTGPGAEAALDRLRLVFPRVIVLREFEELPVEGVQIRNLGGVLGLEYANNLLSRQARLVKRAVDLAAGSVLLVLSLPVLLVSMLVVMVLSPGAPLFLHMREGRRGRTIRVPKVRTMVPDAERQMEDLLSADPRLRREWEAGFKLKSDPRVIPVVGRLLRRLSVDELPQLWSVLKGDMSLVGPRPFPAYHLDALSPQARHLRGEVRPGITGLWQVTARGEADLAAQQAYDIYYIRNWSIWLDLYILLRTAGAVMSGRGAH